MQGQTELASVDPTSIWPHVAKRQERKQREEGKGRERDFKVTTIKPANEEEPGEMSFRS